MRISDWSSDVCSSDLFDIALDLIGLADRELEIAALHAGIERLVRDHRRGALGGGFLLGGHLSLHPLPGKIAGPGCGPSRQVGELRSAAAGGRRPVTSRRSEEHTSELQSLMRISYAVFCLKKKTNNNATNREHTTEQSN